jgi:Tfp pilus assembly protein PilW
MVAASMGVIVVSAIHKLSSKTLWILEEIKASAEVLEHGQYLTGLLSREISMAGFYGDFDYAFTANASMPNICQSVSKKNIVQAMPYPLSGIDNIKEGYKLCNGETVLTDTDVILLRRTSVKKQSPRYRLKSQQMYVQSSFDTADPIIDRGNNATAFKLMQGSKPAPVRAWQQTLYYLSKDKVFKRRRYINGKYARAEPLVDGIEDFQIEYGIATPLGSSECNVDYLTPPLTADQWQRVVAVRFNILARSAWQGVSHRGRQFTYANKTYVIDEGGYYQLFKVLVPIMNKLPNKLQFDIEK